MVWAPGYMKVEVLVPPGVRAEIKRRCRAAFPNETVMFLLGQHEGARYEVEEVWVPPGVLRATPSEVWIDDKWFSEAAGVAEEDDMVLLGAVHSHPYRYKDSRPPFSENTPSQQDFKLGWQGICGICMVREGKTGALRSRVDFFGPAPPVVVK